MPRKRRRNHRGGAERGNFLVKHQQQAAFARNERAFFHPKGPDGTLMLNRVDELDPFTGQKLGRYSPNGLEFSCPDCLHVYTVKEKDLAFWHQYVMHTGPILLRCSHCPRQTPILKVYHHPTEGDIWMEVFHP